ncbi:MAG: exosortase family protein XrtF [Bacteroidetes bacterium]|nr:exosortase family protein XrtF [Bacteroidota bacterium]
MQKTDLFIKRIFDIIGSTIGLIFLSPLIVTCWFLSAWDTRSSGLFFQSRVGQFGKLFSIIKLRTYQANGQISTIGKWLRKHKLDELPQLVNVLIGDMSLVGPRPDIAGYYDQVPAPFDKICRLKPGMTSEAALKYKNEEEWLASQEDPLGYNDCVLFPDKLQMNLDYYHRQSLLLDVKIIWLTVISLFFSFSIKTTRSSFSTMQKFSPVVWFMVRFFGIYFIFVFAYNQYLAHYHDAGRQDPFSRSVAASSAFIVRLWQMEASFYDDTVQPWTWISISGNQVAYVNEGCNAISVMLIFIAFIVAFAKGWRRTIGFLVLGTLLIHIMNIARIFLLCLIYLQHPEWSKNAHDYLFPLAVYGTVFLLLVAWVKIGVKQSKMRADAVVV